MPNEDKIDPKIQELISEFKEQRDSLKKLINDIESLKSSVDKMFPSKIDFRYKQFFEEKIKTAVSLFATILNIRQEINKSLKMEIELRNKIILGNEEKSNIDINDIREAVKKLGDIKINKELKKRLENKETIGEKKVREYIEKMN